MAIQAQVPSCRCRPGWPRRHAQGKRDRPSGARQRQNRGTDSTRGMTLDDRDVLIEQVRSAIRDLLDQGPVWT
jgi:hypothetical protein